MINLKTYSFQFSQRTLIKKKQFPPPLFKQLRKMADMGFTEFQSDELYFLTSHDLYVS